jgi:hypothetical protein
MRKRALRTKEYERFLCAEASFAKSSQSPAASHIRRWGNIQQDEALNSLVRSLTIRGGSSKRVRVSTL